MCHSRVADPDPDRIPMLTFSLKKVPEESMYNSRVADPDPERIPS